MNAPIARDQLTFSLGELSYIGPAYDEEATVSVEVERKQQERGLFRRLVAILAEWRRRRAVMQEMAMMTDRELADIGLSRADLRHIFDPRFAAERASGRDYIAY